MGTSIDALPEPQNSDKAISVARALIKGAAGQIPFAGSFLTEIIDLLFIEPIEERRNEWFKSLAEAIEEIRCQQESLTVEKLANNNEFITTIHRATEIAVRTHQQEKREFLRNAVVNSAYHDSPSFDKRIYFLRLVDELSLNHVVILDLYSNPRKWFEKRGVIPNEFNSAGRNQVLIQAFPGLAKDEDFKVIVVDDLVNRGLLNSLSGIVSGQSVYDAMTSKLANEFLRYISKPTERVDK